MATAASPLPPLPSSLSSSSPTFSETHIEDVSASPSPYTNPHTETSSLGSYEVISAPPSEAAWSDIDTGGSAGSGSYFEDMDVDNGSTAEWAGAVRSVEEEGEGEGSGTVGTRPPPTPEEVLPHRKTPRVDADLEGTAANATEEEVRAAGGEAVLHASPAPRERLEPIDTGGRLARDW